VSDSLHQQFIRFAVQAGILGFGEFETKAGRLSPYFFNAGLFNSGRLLNTLGEFYARTIRQAETQEQLQFDVLFGPAYKGITLASATAVALSDEHRDVPFAFNRKEAKDHGEGGVLVGAPVSGQRVLIIDDVISAGTSVRESIEILRSHDATPAGVLIALDRQERGGTATEVGELSAVQEVEQDLGLPVFAIACLDDLLEFIGSDNSGQLNTAYRERITAYRDRYGVLSAR
jgi:orotate phosphoribosyltransferase